MGAQESSDNAPAERCDSPFKLKAGILQYNFKPFTYDIKKFKRSKYEDGSSPWPRSGHRIVCDETNFYSYGGYNPLHIRPAEDLSVNIETLSLFQELWKYNFAQMTWTKLQVRDIPFALASNAVLLSGKILMVYGGTGVPFHIARNNNLYVCNLAEDDLRFVRVEVTGKIPPPLYGQAVFLKDNYFYAIGGTTGFEYYTDIHRLDLRTNEWEEVYIHKGLRNEPSGRYRHELAVVDDKVYILGGGIGNEAYDFEKLPVFDLTSRTWNIVATVQDDFYGYPSPRQYHSAINIPGTTSFIIVGGVDDDNVLNDAWQLDIPSMKWMKTSLQLCKPVYFHSSCVTPSGKMYTFGGVTMGTAQPSVKRIAHVQSAWVCIPKLKDICWEAVTHYYSLSELPKEKMQTFIPLEYYDKLDL